jgi:hypothetical protein
MSPSTEIFISKLIEKYKKLFKKSISQELRNKRTEVSFAIFTTLHKT